MRTEGEEVLVSLRFPPHFIWGAGTAAYQVEGAARTDGRAPSIWDEYLRTLGYRGDNGDIAADHYHRAEEDLDSLADLGASHYRFSVSWSRVMPDGRQVNQKGLDFYRRLVDGLHRRGVKPALTLYHMDLPARLATRGGWADRDVALRFGEYVQVVAQALGSDVDLWMTVNEPYYEAWFGYCEGSFPPGYRDTGMAAAALHHLLLAHGQAVRIVHAEVPGAQVGPVLGYAPAVPGTEHPDDRRAATIADQFVNRALLDPIMLGRYPTSYAEEPRRAQSLRRVVRDGDLEVISTPVDFLGINYYFPRVVVAPHRLEDVEVLRAVDTDLAFFGLRHLADVGAAEVRHKSEWTTLAGWAPYPEGMTKALLEVAARYGDTPIIITENGLPLADYVDPDGAVNDVERIHFLDDHLRATRRAMDLGADVRGFFVWSLLDNLEWTAGFQHRFGLTYVDFGTQRRIRKASFHWFKDVIAGTRSPRPENELISYTSGLEQS